MSFQTQTWHYYAPPLRCHACTLSVFILALSVLVKHVPIHHISPFAVLPDTSFDPCFLTLSRFFSRDCFFSRCLVNLSELSVVISDLFRALLLFPLILFIFENSPPGSASFLCLMLIVIFYNFTQPAPKALSHTPVKLVTTSPQFCLPLHYLTHVIRKHFIVLFNCRPSCHSVYLVDLLS